MTHPSSSMPRAQSMLDAPAGTAVVLNGAGGLRAAPYDPDPVADPGGPTTTVIGAPTVDPEGD